MANIEYRGPLQYRVKVRRNGLPSQTRTFETKAEASRWAKRVEGKIEDGAFVDNTEAKDTTLKDALDLYLKEVTPLKRGAKQETNRIKAWKLDPLAERPLYFLKPSDVREWRDARLAEGKAPTTIRNSAETIRP